MADASKSASRIPEFASLKEEAEFWDTHSLAGFEDELEPVECEVVHPLQHSFGVTLTSEEFHRLMNLSRHVQTSPFDLLAQWVREGLGRAEASPSSDARYGSAAE